MFWKTCIVLVLFVSATAVPQWQPIKIVTDYTNFNGEQAYLERLTRRIDLALHYLEGLVQVPQQTYTYQVPQGTPNRNRRSKLQR
jgi:hypothetical protein